MRGSVNKFILWSKCFDSMGINKLIINEYCIQITLLFTQLYFMTVRTKEKLRKFNIKKTIKNLENGGNIIKYVHENGKKIIKS